MPGADDPSTCPTEHSLGDNGEICERFQKARESFQCIENAVSNSSPDLRMNRTSVPEILKPSSKTSVASIRRPFASGAGKWSALFPQNEYEAYFEVLVLLLASGTIWNYWNIMKILASS